LGIGNCFGEGGPGAIKIGGSPFKTLAEASDIFCTMASPLVRHAEVVQRDQLLTVGDANAYLPSGAVRLIWTLKMKPSAFASVCTQAPHWALHQLV
jgi:hypothetical protein